jgi:hypothetical protein
MRLHGLLVPLVTTVLSAGAGGRPRLLWPCGSRPREELSHSRTRTAGSAGPPCRFRTPSSSTRPYGPYNSKTYGSTFSPRAASCSASTIPPAPSTRADGGSRPIWMLPACARPKTPGTDFARCSATRFSSRRPPSWSRGPQCISRIASALPVHEFALDLIRIGGGANETADGYRRAVLDPLAAAGGYDVSAGQLRRGEPRRWRVLHLRPPSGRQRAGEEGRADRHLSSGTSAPCSSRAPSTRMAADSCRRASSWTASPRASARRAPAAGAR